MSSHRVSLDQEMEMSLYVVCWRVVGGECLSLSVIYLYEFDRCCDEFRQQFADTKMKAARREADALRCKLIPTFDCLPKSYSDP